MEPSARPARSARARRSGSRWRRRSGRGRGGSLRAVSELGGGPGGRLAAFVLRRIHDGGAEAISGVPDQARIVEERAREGDEVRLAGGDDRLGLLGGSDEARDARGQPGRAADARRERDVVAGRRGDLRGDDVAGGDTRVATAQVAQGGRERDGILDGAAAVGVVGGGDAGADSRAIADGREHGVREAQREPVAVRERAPVLVGAVVRERRGQLVTEVAVREVELEDVEADAHGALGGLDKRGDERGELRRVERVRRGPGLRERERRRRDGRPRVLGGGEGLAAALPRDVDRRLATGVRELDAEPGADRRDGAARGEDAGERALVVIAVEPEAAVRDAPATLDGGGLDHHEPGAAQGEVHEVLQVPIGGRAVVRRVLAHRRDDDAVR